MTAPLSLPLDVVIFGGGSAGLWTLDTLRRAGHRAVLLETAALGQGQTVCAQGIIHGGVKYTLDGLLRGSATAIREMPRRWRACLQGEETPDLSATRVRAESCHMWRTASLSSRLGMIGARVGLRTAPVPVEVADRPAVLAGCPGTVARVDEPVIDPVSLLEALAAPHAGAVLHIDGDQLAIEARDGVVDAIRIAAPDGSRTATLYPNVVVLTAGAGNDKLAKAMGVSTAPMQRRPLHMVMMRGTTLPELNGHCVDGAHTRVTITADTDAAGRTVWQLGGQIAEDGTAMDEPTLIDHAVTEVREVLPDVDLTGVEWATYRVDRAEPATGRGVRPDDVYAEQFGSTIVAWPTKMALAPVLADRIASMVDAPRDGASDASMLDDWPRPAVAAPPWETVTSWTAAR